jgi:hypothetical protein
MGRGGREQLLEVIILFYCHEKKEHFFRGKLENRGGTSFKAIEESNYF